MTESNNTRKRRSNRLPGERESAIISRSAAVMRRERYEQARESSTRSRSSKLTNAPVGKPGKSPASGSRGSSSSVSSRGHSTVHNNHKQREREVLLRLRIILISSIVLCLVILIRLMTGEPDDSAKADSSAVASIVLEEAQEEAVVPVPTAIPEQPEPVRTQAELYLEENAGGIPSRRVLEVDSILQEPELPTGCESVALTMALNALGYNLKKTTIADDYLVYSDYNLVLGYVGDPYTDDGAGVFPHGLTLTANRFLQTNGHSHVAYDISGTDFDDLLVYLAGGYPVIIWSTINYEPVLWSNDRYSYEGKDFRWYWNEHCIMLQGYDLEQGKCYILDPLKGEVEIAMEKIRNLYTEIGRYSVTIL